MKKYFAEAARLFDEVVRKDAYSGRVGGKDTPAMTERLLLGALEKFVRDDYILHELVEKRPAPVIYALLHVGVYALLDIDNVPDYAVISECVEAAGLLGKRQAGSFVNAVLRKVQRREYTLPAPGSPGYAAVHYGKPEFFIKLLEDRFGKEKAALILEEPAADGVHIRVNRRLCTPETVAGILDAHATERLPSEVGGMYLKPTDEVRELFKEGMITYQSPSSMLAVQALAPADGTRILDLCAAPGGARAGGRDAYPRSLRRSRRQSRLYLRALSLLRSRGVRAAPPPRRTHPRVREAYARGQCRRARAGRYAARAGVRKGFRFCARRRAV